MIYKFTCACCNACYTSAKLVVIFPHAPVNISLQTSLRTSSSTCKAQNVVVNLADCFEILDSAPTKFQLKLEEAMPVNWEKHFKSTSSSRQPDTYALGFIFFQTLCNSFKYGFCPRVPVQKSRYKRPNNTQQLTSDFSTKKEQWLFLCVPVDQDRAQICYQFLSFNHN